MVRGVPRAGVIVNVAHGLLPAAPAEAHQIKKTAAVATAARSMEPPPVFAIRLWDN